METRAQLITHAARTLRALRRATGVRVELRTIGEETEFDKAVAEQLVDPITQLCATRSPTASSRAESASRSGKPADGDDHDRARGRTATCSSSRSPTTAAASTPAALRERFVATGRWTPGARAARHRRRVLDALLGTGVSSRGDADELAGRGIGLDLVRADASRASAAR